MCLPPIVYRPSATNQSSEPGRESRPSCFGIFACFRKLRVYFARPWVEEYGYSRGQYLTSSPICQRLERRHVSVDQARLFRPGTVQLVQVAVRLFRSGVVYHSISQSSIRLSIPCVARMNSEYKLKNENTRKVSPRLGSSKPGGLPDSWSATPRTAHKIPYKVSPSGRAHALTISSWNGIGLG